MNFVAIDTDIAGDRVTYAIAAAIGVPRREAVGILTLFFAGVAKHADDGNLAGILDCQLEDWCLWDRQPGELARIVRAQLCDERGVLRRWDDWNGRMIRRAKAERLRKQRAREAAALEKEAAERAKAASAQGRSADAAADSPRTGRGRGGGPAHVPDLTVPDRTLTTTTTAPLSADTPKVIGGWPAAVAEAWCQQVGVIAAGRVGKQLQPFIRTYSDPARACEAAVAAVGHYAQACARNDERARWPVFVSEILRHVPRTLKPDRDAAA